MDVQTYDAVVGDVTITAKRSEVVDFTQSIKDSGLVVVVPVENTKSSYPWAFLRPFSTTMWCTTLVFFVFTGLVIWLLEHKKNRDFQGHPRKQVVTFLW
jgi:ionotropic glutamate receptor